MNTLIFFMSRLGKDAKEIIYTPVGFQNSYAKPVNGRQTNEAAAKYLIGSLAAEGGRLDRIIAVTSKETIGTNSDADAFDTFCKGLEEFCEELPLPEIIPVRSFGENGELPSERILSDVMNYISTEDTIFLDITGGRRTDADMIMLLMKLLRYKGINLSQTIYSDKTGTVSSHNSFYRSLDILDGVNQFSTSGRSSQLIACFADKAEDSAVRRLLASMEELTDNINLCQTSELDRLLENMRRLMEEVASEKTDDMDTFLFMQLLPVIKNKFFGVDDKPDYCRIIDWCLDNHLVQQAVTLFVEKLPLYLFDKGIIKADAEIIEEVKKAHSKPEPINLEKELFYTRLMSSNGKDIMQAREDELVEKLRTALKNGERSDDPVLASALKKIYNFMRFAEGYDVLMDAFDEINRNPYENRNFRKMAEIFAGCKTPSPKTTEKYKVRNWLAVNDKFLQAALSTKQQPDKRQIKDSVENKFNTAFRADTAEVPDGFSYGADKKEIRYIMLSYLYVRSVRNRINHAADEENLNDRQKEILKRFGFSAENEDFNSETIIKQIKAVITRLTELKISTG